ncbi:MAG: YcaQ family DNA glycosylase [Microbacteriaceae bacterium]|nr:YcaQ family DNA glycosylase [Microbacteriaceae bacterium]
MVDKVSPAAARRIALAAQGFGRPRSAGAGGSGSGGLGPGAPAVGTRQLNLALRRLAVLQLDSVNVLERSHYLPLFARLGSYDKTMLDRLTFARRGPYREYWAHEAALIPVEDWPLFRFRMREYRDWYAAHPDAEWHHAEPRVLSRLRSELAANGPMPASAFEREAERARGPWWDWDHVKRGLERMFRLGEVVSGGRKNFERVYALPEQVLPADLIEHEVPEGDAKYELMRRAAIAHGIGTLNDLADYFRIKPTRAKDALQRLVDEGEVLPVTVPGWNRPAYLHKDARIPRRMETAALLSPFDPVVWERDRALRMFGFHYRIEIYTPAPKRVYGYYTLPVLIDDALVGRIDLKNDRQAKVLRVQSAWREDGAVFDVERIVPVLHEMASWQGCESIAVADRGDLARELAGALGVIAASGA